MTRYRLKLDTAEELGAIVEREAEREAALEVALEEARALARALYRRSLGEGVPRLEATRRRARLLEAELVDRSVCPRCKARFAEHGRLCDRCARARRGGANETYRARREPLAKRRRCKLCGELGHFAKACPRNSAARTEGDHGAD